MFARDSLCLQLNYLYDLYFRPKRIQIDFLSLHLEVAWRFLNKAFIISNEIYVARKSLSLKYAQRMHTAVLALAAASIGNETFVILQSGLN